MLDVPIELSPRRSGRLVVIECSLSANLESEEKPTLVAEEGHQAGRSK